IRPQATDRPPPSTAERSRGRRARRSSETLRTVAAMVPVLPFPRRSRPTPAYPVPWRVERVDPVHPIVRHGGEEAADAVRVFICDAAGPIRTERWGLILPGEAPELCRADADPASGRTSLAWFRAGSDAACRGRASVR